MHLPTRPDRIPHLLAACALAALAACGGGGGGDTAVPAPETPVVFDAATAVANYLRATSSWTMTGTSTSGTAYTMDVSIAAGDAEAFPVTGTAATVFTTNVGLAAAGVGSVSTQSDSFFDATSGAMLGIRTLANGASSCLKLQAAPATPGASVALNASGDLFVAALTSDCTTDATVDGRTLVARWSVEQISGVNYLCLSSSYRNADSTEVSSEKNCVEISATGTLGARARSTVTSSNLTLSVSTTP